MPGALFDSPIGTVFAREEGGAITRLSLERFDHEECLAAARDKPSATLRRLGRWLDAYFKGKNPAQDFALDLRGTAFQRDVWNITAQIPYGKTATYGRIAGFVAIMSGKDAMSARAVGQAMKSNPIALLIPCHRVVASNGLGGYFGSASPETGPGLKRFLLELEGAKV